MSGFRFVGVFGQRLGIRFQFGECLAVADNRRELVTIEDSVLVSLAVNAKAVAEFPFLKALADHKPPKPGCGRCGRTSDRGTSFAEAKRVIAGLADDKKQRLKAFLNARRARVLYRDPVRKVIIARTF